MQEMFGCAYTDVARYPETEAMASWNLQPSFYGKIKARGYVARTLLNGHRDDGLRHQRAMRCLLFIAINPGNYSFSHKSG